MDADDLMCLLFTSSD